MRSDKKLFIGALLFMAHMDEQQAEKYWQALTAKEKKLPFEAAKRIAKENCG